MRKHIHHLKKAFSTPEYLKIFTLRIIGNFLVLSSLFMIAKTFYLPVREEMRYFIEQRLQKKYLVADGKDTTRVRPHSTRIPKGLLAKAFNFNSVEVLIPEEPNFSVVIPKIAANAKILANVDTADERVYLKALQQGVAHAQGTAFPGEGGHIFLFAHSTDYFWNVGTYNAVFYLLSKLEKGDEVDIFYQGQRYVYKVIGSQLVNPSQVQYLTRKANREFLTLQTCWPPGTTLKRLLVFAVRVSD